MRKPLFKILLGLLIFCTLGKLCYSVTGGFSVSNVLSKHPVNPAWEIQEQHLPSFDQKFKYLNCGGQSYAFLSEDGKTILKLFKQHHLTPYSFLRHIPFHLLPLPKRWPFLIEKFLHKREQKRAHLFKSITLAYTHLQEHAGLLYLHLNPTDTLHQKIILIDKLGSEHSVDLDTLDFALQVKAELPEAHFLRLKKEGDLEAAKTSIDSLLSLILNRCRHGIRDLDPGIYKNSGFIGNTAIDVDVGSFVEDHTVTLPFVTKTTLYYTTRNFHTWIQNHYLEAGSYFTERLETLLGGSD